MAEPANSKAKPNTDYFSAHPRVYLGRLPITTTREEILNLFAKYGEI